MSGYKKIPDCDCNEKEFIIIDKEFESDCGCESCKLILPKEKGIILGCGQQSRVIEFVFQPPGTTITPNIEIARTTIDLTCLCNPQVIINFCSIINFLTIEPGDLTYTITLFKECEHIAKYPLAKFEYSYSSIPSNRSYCFKFCDYNTSCTGCCSYIVELTRAESIITSADPIMTSIEQGVVVAKAQGLCNKGNYREILDFNGYLRTEDFDFGEKETIIMVEDLKENCGCEPCKLLHPKAREIITACGQQFREIAFVDFTSSSSDFQAIEIARVSIDLSCLCTPLVIIDFSSIISLNMGSVYTITLFKECKNIEKYPLSTFVYSEGLPGIDNIQPFCFTFCDLNTSCTGCCSYIVELTELETFQPTTASIKQSVVKVIAQGSCTD